MKNTFSFWIVFSLCLTLHQTASAQFQLNGTATVIDSLCYSLTPNSAFKTGSIWNLTQLDLNQSFTLEIDVFLGCVNIPGADGLVFGLQNINTSVGTTGEGMGFGGISPSLGVEFDTYPNFNLGDPTNDHVAIIKNGDNNHDGPNNLAGPIQCDPGSTNIEDCEYHEVKIEWIQPTKKFSVYYDCVLRLSITEDMVNTIFGGNSMVYWGFTAATGGEFNTHRICLKYASINAPQPDVSLCDGQATQLFAPAPGAQTISWSPATGLSNPNVANPFANPTETTTYIVTCQLTCSNTTKDTITVAVGAFDAQINQPDQSICPGEDLLIDTDAAAGATFLWSTGATTASILANSTGTYTVTVTKEGCTATDSIKIYVLPQPNTIFGLDTTLCEGDTILLGLPTAVDVSLSWTDGNTDSIRTITEIGTYTLEITSLTNGCSTSDQISFDFSITPTIALADTTACFGNSIILDATYTDASYFWNDSSTLATLQVDSTGTYTVAVTLGNCTSLTQAEVKYIDPPSVLFPNDTTICLGGSLLLVAEGENATFLWQDGTKLPTYTVTLAGLYGVVAKNNCGVIIEDVIINAEDCQRLFLPTVFSPNGDGINDGFGPAFSTNVIRINEMRIWDRWGGLVYFNQNYAPNDPEQEWNGNLQNLPVAIGVYMYEVTASFRDGTQLTFIGDINLVR